MFLQSPIMTENGEFAQHVISDIIQPIRELLVQFEAANSDEEYIYFSTVVDLISDPSNEADVIAAVIELSNCAFLGFYYPDYIQEKINKILDDSILIAHAMSADQQPQ
jgi:hypothetical protein